MEVKEIVEELRKLSDDERIEIIGEFCSQCGADDPGCQCWNDS